MYINTHAHIETDTKKHTSRNWAHTIAGLVSLESTGQVGRLQTQERAGPAAWGQNTFPGKAQCLLLRPSPD